MTALRLKKVSKSFGTVNVIKELDLEVEEGAFIVFVGPSGCGKSTLLRMIAGLETLTSGEIEIGDEVVTMRPPAKRGIAMVFQSYALYPHLSARDNMSVALKQEGVPKAEIERRIENAAKTLSLSTYLERRPAELSGGQRQRVAIGRAIVRDPKLFLFDEPLSNLDAALRVNMRLELVALHRQLKASMIYVTHDQTEAMTLADKIVILRDGKIEQVGAPLDLYNNPANKFVAGFLGAPSMNFFNANLLNSSFSSAKKAKTAGIRPEHFRIDPKGEISGVITHVEKLGGDTNVFIRLATDELLTVRIFGQKDFLIGEPLLLSVNPENVYFFDAEGIRV